jgi:hypothetical protein
MLLCSYLLHEPCNCFAGLYHPMCHVGPAPSGCTHSIAVPLTAACTASLCLHWLTLYLYIFFLLFSANSLFCSPVTTLSLPSLPTDGWPSSPSSTYHSATTNCNVNDNGHVRTMTVAVAPCGTVTVTVTCMWRDDRDHNKMQHNDRDCDDNIIWHNNNDCDTTCSMATMTMQPCSLMTAPTTPCAA